MQHVMGVIERGRVRMRNCDGFGLGARLCFGVCFGVCFGGAVWVCLFLFFVGGKIGAIRVVIHTSV